MVNGGQRPDFGGQRSDSLQIYILGISIPNARCMQNLGSIRPLGAILRPPVLIKRDFAVPLYCKNSISNTSRMLTTIHFCLILTGLAQLIITEISIWLTRPLPMKMKRIWLETIPTVYQLRLCWWLAMMILISVWIWSQDLLKYQKSNFDC